MAAFRIAVMLELETNDPRLSKETLAEMPDVRTLAKARRAVLQHIPKDVQRVIAILPVEQAKHLMLLHEAVGRELGVEITHHVPGFVPPTQE
jgi:hypothetical protein